MAAQASSPAPPGLLTLAPPPLDTTAIRVNHTGLQANLAPVLSVVEALGAGLRSLGRDADIGAALAVARESWEAKEP